MNTFSLRILAALALACCALSSCDSFNGGAADVVNPTINQQDDLDVRWGLPRRVSKTGRRSSAAISTTTTSAAAPVAGATVNEVPSSAVSEDVKNKLR